MTKEKRGSEPELKLWDSPGTTKNIRRTEKQDNWIFYGAKNGRCSMTGITVWSKNGACAGLPELQRLGGTPSIRYAVRTVHPPSCCCTI